MLLPLVQHSGQLTLSEAYTPVSEAYIPVYFCSSISIIQEHKVTDSDCFRLDVLVADCGTDFLDLTPGPPRTVSNQDLC